MKCNFNTSTGAGRAGLVIWHTGHFPGGTFTGGTAVASLASEIAMNQQPQVKGGVGGGVRVRHLRRSYDSF